MADNPSPSHAAGRSRWSRLNDAVLARLSRVTSTTNFIAELDGMRFLAIFSVIVLHINTNLRREALARSVEFHPPPEADWLGIIAHRGGAGVMIFFAISGFILALPFAMHYLRDRKLPRLRDYYWRRITRLEPPYLITMLLFFAIRIIVDHQRPAEAFPHLLASMSYTHYFIYNTWSTINGVAWSLEVEVQFYILAPFLATVYRIRPGTLRRAVILAAICASIVFRYLFSEALRPLHLELSLLSFLHWFLIGFLLADIYIDIWRSAPTSGSLVWDVAGFLAICGIFLDIGHTNLAGQIVPALCTLVFFMSVFRGRLVRAFFRNRYIATIGGMCYTIYLLHYAFIALMMKGTHLAIVGHSFWLNVLIQGVVILPVLLLTSALFFALIERPCMYRDWPQKLLRRLRLIPPSEATPH